MIRLTASDFYTYLRPQVCVSRVYRRHHGEPEQPPGPYEELLLRLGQLHEKTHLAAVPKVVDLSLETREHRESKTLQEVKKKDSAIYQAAFRATTILAGIKVEIVGDPDFLIPESGHYLIRDSKISRRINEKDHPEIIRALQLYGWLYEQTLRNPPHRLEVHSGTGNIIEVEYDHGAAALNLLEQILSIKTSRTRPYSPVGWSKCRDCGFFQSCWPAAEQNRDVALVSGVDQGLAIALRGAGVHTAADLLSRFDESSLADFKRPWGAKLQKVGKRAESILRMARAMTSGKEILIESPAIPDFPNYVMFDLEGLPPTLDELEKVYLWGLQVYGMNPGEFLAATAGFGPDGDREGWLEFLRHTKAILEKYGDIPFVHWHHYERVRLDLYIERYGDSDGIASRVRNNLLDLLPITQNSVALPLPSYSLKVVERYVGYERTLDEYGGDWAMAKYIEATETEDEAKRRELMNKILAYNREDLEATWAVLKWLRNKCS